MDRAELDDIIRKLNWFDEQDEFVDKFLAEYSEELKHPIADPLAEEAERLEELRETFAELNEVYKEDHFIRNENVKPTENLNVSLSCHQSFFLKLSFKCISSKGLWADQMANWTFVIFLEESWRWSELDQKLLFNWLSKGWHWQSWVDLHFWRRS